MVSDCSQGTKEKKIDSDTHLHGVLILTGERVDSTLLDALLALGEALVPGSEVGLAGVIRRGADFKRCQGRGGGGAKKTIERTREQENEGRGKCLLSNSHDCESGLSGCCWKTDKGIAPRRFGGFRYSRSGRLGGLKSKTHRKLAKRSARALPG